MPLLQDELTKKVPGLAVVFHGRTNHSTAMRLLSDSDILLMPSRYEGLPIALLEAMGRGAVPVASNLPDITDDAVSDGVNGVLVPVGDIDGFAQAIARLQDDQVRLQMSKATWQTAREQFSKDIMVARYLALLNSPRQGRLAGADSPDLIGRKLFGRRWKLPRGVMDLIGTIRRSRLFRRSTSTPPVF